MKVLKNSTFSPPPAHKLRCGYKGSGILIVAMVTALMTGVISLSVTKLNQMSFNGMNNSKIMLQSQQYAESEAALIKATKYDDLTAQNKEVIQNSNGYLSEVVLSSENELSDGVMERIASINIYKDDDVLPRYTLKVHRRSIEEEPGSGGIPIGTVIAWISTTAPSEGGTWLLCNGQSCTAYPELKALIGNNVPNLNARFLEGTTGTPRSYKEAGLPNITGTGTRFHAELWTPSNTANHNDGAILKGTSYGECQKTGTNDDNRASSYGWNFDASKSNSIYGASSTVQPSSYLVRYYIKAA